MNTHKANQNLFTQSTKNIVINEKEKKNYGEMYNKLIDQFIQERNERLKEECYIKDHDSINDEIIKNANRRRSGLYSKIDKYYGSYDKDSENSIKSFNTIKPNNSLPLYTNTCLTPKPKSHHGITEN